MTKIYSKRGSSFSFSPTGGPIDFPVENSALFYELGKAIAAWSRMENLLTALVIHINKKAASEALFDANSSDAFKKKVRLLQRWMGKHEPLASLRDVDDAKLFEALKKTSDIRNLLAHGLFISYERDSETSEVAGIKRVGEDEWNFSTRRVSLKEIEHLYSQANIANMVMVSIADEVFSSPSK